MNRNSNTKCEHCDIPLYRRPSQLKRQKHVLCIKCRSKVASENAKIGAKKKRKEYIERWKNGLERGTKGPNSISSHIRNYLFEKYDYKCSKCGWEKENPFTKKVPLEVEHIDGNSSNNKEENLTLLCPNCHSLTPTYKGANRGKGRYNRMKRYKDHKSY